MKILLLVIGICILSIPMTCILSYLAGFLNQYMVVVFIDERYWFEKGTLLGDIHNKIVSGENYSILKEAKYIPVVNLCFSGGWLLGELVLLILLTVFLILKRLFMIFILGINFIFMPILETNKYLKETPHSLVMRIRNILMKIRDRILKIRIA